MWYSIIDYSHHALLYTPMIIHRVSNLSDSLYLLTPLTHFTHSPSPFPSENHHSVSMGFVLFVLFFRFHM